MTTSNVKRLAIPAALVIGGVTAGSFLAPIGLVSAQTDDTDSVDPESGADDSTADGDERPDDRRRGGHRFGARAEVLEDVLGLPATEIRDALADGNTLAQVADAQGVSAEELTTALVGAATDKIDEAVADGRLDADEAEERKAGLEERVAELIDRAPPEDFGERGRGHHRLGRAAKAAGEATSEALGLSTDEIRAGLDDGKSLADLAEEQGVSTDDLAAAMVADATERIDQAVADGKIDEDRADEAKANLEEMVAEAIEAEPFALGRGLGRAEGRGLRHHHRSHHRDGGAETDSADGASDDGEVVESGLTDA